MLAGALIVDGEIAALESELAQIVAVEAGFADSVDPGQKRGEDIASAARCGAGRHRRHGAAATPRRGGSR